MISRTFSYLLSFRFCDSNLVAIIIIFFFSFKILNLKMKLFKTAFVVLMVFDFTVKVTSETISGFQIQTDESSDIWKSPNR